MNQDQFFWLLFSFILTIMIFSYIFGDNPLFRIATYFFIGVTSAYVFVLIFYQVFLPKLILPLLTGDLNQKAIQLIPIILSSLLIFKLFNKTSSIGNTSLAFLVGSGAAIILTSAFSGTLLPMIDMITEPFSLNSLNFSNLMGGIILLIGAAVGTFFTGSSFTLNEYNLVTWTTPLRGLEAAFSLFNLSLGLFLVFNARILGAMYLINNIDFSGYEVMEQRTRRAVLVNLLCALPFLLYVLISLLLMDGFGFDPKTGVVSLVSGKYLSNLLAMPVVLIFLLLGVVLVVWGVVGTAFRGKTNGIWFGGSGTVLVGLTVFFLAGFNNTAFYPSKVDLQSSLTIYNASSSHYTLTAMTYVALIIPVVLAYIAYVWRLMDAKKMSASEVLGNQADEMY